ncbi:MAG: lipoprotein localization factor LolB [Burkholderiaceae bacterium]|nr:lipoprotein localization factor LolB [Burkholderiaceae bacterium]
MRSMSSVQRVRACLLAAFVSAILSACATPGVTLPDRAFTGRFSVTTTSGTQRENVSGRFNLEIRGRRQVLELGSPLGTTVARVEVEPGGARATGAQMHEVRGPDADAITEQLLGWPLPVAGLADWIEGRPSPERIARVDRDGGRVVLIEQDGWTIRLPEYFEHIARPRRLVLERAAIANAPAVTLRLVVDEPAG